MTSLADWPDPARGLLWTVEAPETPDPSHLALLDKRERKACARLATAPLRARYACAHALLRSVLAPLLDQAPGRIELVPGNRKRPELRGKSRSRGLDLDFNLSGSGPHIACALARGARVGVDLEQGGGQDKLHAVAARVLTPHEQRWLAEHDDWSEGFGQLWTLKESIAKAHGEGIGLRFDQLLALPGPDAVALDLGALGPDGCWRVVSLRGVIPTALALWGRTTTDLQGPLVLSPPCPDGFRSTPLAWGKEGHYPA